MKPSKSILPIIAGTGAVLGLGYIALVVMGNRPAPKPTFHSYESQLDNCVDFSKYGWPTPGVIPLTETTKTSLTGLCRKAYAVVHDNYAKIPRWVAYTLTPEHTLGCEPRSDMFEADPDLPKESHSKPSDYSRSGYDMGHIANSADMSWDKSVLRQSFYLSNITPQTPSLNRGAWKDLETAIRNYVHNTDTPVTIFAGPTYSFRSSTRVTIGDGVAVPIGFFKIIVNNKTDETWAFWFPNTISKDTNYKNYQVSVSLVEEQSKLVFPVPGDKEVRLKLFDSGKSINHAKSEACKK